MDPLTAIRICSIRFVLALLSLLAAVAAQAQEVMPLPPFFVETFLDFPEDAAEAAKSDRRLLLYFGQEGCPYCKELLVTNFAQREVVERTSRSFVPIALNIWGDRETRWFDGIRRSEKDLAKFLRVQFTPTVALLDERGQIVARLNGYYPPQRFLAALEFVASKRERHESFADHMQSVPLSGARPKLTDEAFLLRARTGEALDLRRRTGSKPLAVIFETPHCAACDEMHDLGFRHDSVTALLSRFDVARLSLAGKAALLTPQGLETDAASWARSLKVSYVPSILFFDRAGVEVFRLESYVRPFHLASSFAYVAEEAYLREPEFQRFLRERSERLRGGQALEAKPK